MHAEPLLGMVTKVVNNNVIAMKIHGKPFTCKNFGVLALDEIEGLENTCKQRLEAFQVQHPYYRYFSQMHLKRYQQYHLTIVDGQQCILYAQGKKSLAELLLEAGLAVHRQRSKEGITDYKYQRAVRRARNLKKGIYSDAVLRSCIHLFE